MLIDYLLDKCELQQLTVYRQLKEQDSLTPSKLRELNGLKHTQLEQILRDIQVTLNQVAPTSQLTYNSKRVSLHPNAPSVQDYRQAVLQQSLISQVILFMLAHPDKKLVDFCQEYYVSRATVFRRLDRFHDLLTIFQVKLNVTQLNLCGKELSIRYLLLTLLLLIQPDLTKLAPLSSEETQMLHNLSALFDPTTASDHQKALLFPIQIGALRRRAGFFIKEVIPLDQIPIPKELLLQQKTLLTDYLATSTPDFYHQREYNAFYFFLYTSPVYTRYDTKLFQAFQEWCAKKYEGQQIIQRLCKKIARHFFSGHPPESFDLIEANLVCLFYISQLLGYAPPFNYLELEGNLRHRSPIYHQVEQFCENFLQNIAKRQGYAWLSSNTSCLASSFAYLLSPSVVAHTRHKIIRVSVLAEHYFISTMPLYFFLCNQPHVELVPCDQLSKTPPDLVIFQQASSLPRDYLGDAYRYSSHDVLTNFTDLASCLHHLQKAGISFTEPYKNPN